MHYKIGSRGSQLALVQTESVKARLRTAYPDDTFEIVILSSRGDRDQTRPLEALGAGAFVRDLEERLLAGEVDLLVHSMKDLPAVEPEGLVLAQCWTRADPRDALVSREGKTLEELPKGAVVATGSVRRTYFLRQRRPDLKFVPIRGNVDTRLKKLKEVDALVLACAGLDRLGRSDVITERLDPTWMIPAPNQGQLAIELRAADTGLKAKIDVLSDAVAERVAQAERDYLKSTGATCRDAVAAYAQLVDGEIKLASFFEKKEPSVVTLVGAGPGDPGLITVKGLAAIRAAEAIVYDRLIPKELLAEACPSCELHDVGKTSGHHPLPQDEINALLAELASRHARIVRLKGGDPFVFGRGGEEIAYLSARGIRTEVIPGISSAIAAAESVRIPVTHRGVASGFEVITAHGREGQPAEIDFTRLTDPKRTLVFLMGLSQIEILASSLMAAGRDPATPAAVISAATTPMTQCVTGTLGDITPRVREAAVASPAVFIVGSVVALRRELGLPLAGKRFLLPVLEGGSSTLATRLRALGGETTEVTVGRIVPIDGALTEADFEGVDRIVFTSKNGRLGLTPDLQAAAERRGIRIENVRTVKPEGVTLHLTQPDAERVAGVKSIDVYRNEPLPIDGPLDLSVYDAVLFTCASSVHRVLAASTGTTLALAIGPRTAAAAQSDGRLVVKAAVTPTLDALLNLAVEALILI